MRNYIYYNIKPFVSRPIRMGIRRWLAMRKRKLVGDIWPIFPGSSRPPEGWTGWPDGKSFAFVLTHDVEGREGLAKCRQLMELEMELGFRSSFNFVPEGEYTVAREFREELRQNGFEIGVHDLHHDGKLYSTRRGFLEKTKRINYYLKEWGAIGFRGAFMLHNLEWLHDLDLQYDASSFDTDPFEPQPENFKTIFPFWVNSPSFLNSHRSPAPLSCGGYVELPYTLPQDSTLFLLFREPTINIWQQKLDWIAGHGGMTLLNVHPDYICFEGKAEPGNTYPLARYRQFLEYVKSEYAGRIWHALPGRVASLFRGGRFGFGCLKNRFQTSLN